MNKEYSLDNLNIIRTIGLKKSCNTLKSHKYPVMAYKVDSHKRVVLIVEHDEPVVYIFNDQYCESISRIKISGAVHISASLAAYTKRGTFISINRQEEYFLEFDCYGNVLWKQSYSGQRVNPLVLFADNRKLYFVDSISRNVFLVDLHTRRTIPYLEIPNALLYGITSISITTEGDCLICNAELGKVYMLGICGEVLWESSDRIQLAGPQNAQALDRCSCVITDRLNSRVLEIYNANTISWEYKASIMDTYCDNELYFPMFACKTSENTYLICDTYNERVIEVATSKNIIWASNKKYFESRLFARPRELTFMQSDITTSSLLLVCDTVHNRILKMKPDGTVIGSITTINGKSLYWPRSCDYSLTFGVIIADSRNNRIAIINSNGCKEFSSYFLNNREVSFADPHMVAWLDNGDILICDTGNRRVVVVIIDQASLCAAWSSEQTMQLLSDPHYARIDHDGNIIIADTGNNRLLVCTKAQTTFEISCLFMQEASTQLIKPRYFELLDKKTISIVDSHTGHIVYIDYAGKVKNVVIPNDPTLADALRSSRCFRSVGTMVAISDIEHSKIYFATISND